MQTHGYEQSKPWRLSLDLLDHVRKLTDAFGDDPSGHAGTLRSIAADLPVRAAICFEQLDYDSATQHAASLSERLLELFIQAQVAGHVGLLCPRQLKELRRKLDTLDAEVLTMPDELFEDDGEPEKTDADRRAKLAELAQRARLVNRFDVQVDAKRIA